VRFRDLALTGLWGMLALMFFRFFDALALAYVALLPIMFSLPFGAFAVPFTVLFGTLTFWLS
jgi:hypothetical protein